MERDLGGLVVSVLIAVVLTVAAGRYRKQRQDRWGWVAVTARQLSGPRVPGLFPLPRLARHWHPRRLRTSPGVVELGFAWGAAPTTRLLGAVARATGEQTPSRLLASVEEGKELVLLHVAGAVVELAVEPDDLPAILADLAPPNG